MNTNLDTLTERRVTRIVTTAVDAPYKYDNGITKGWAVDVRFLTDDNTGPYVVAYKYALKRDAVDCQRRHLDGTAPTVETTVTTDPTGRAVLWTECWGTPFRG
jgi:hypothetical protein